MEAREPNSEFGWKIWIEKCRNRYENKNRHFLRYNLKEAIEFAAQAE